MLTIILLIFVQIVCMGIATELLIQEEIPNRNIRVVLLFVFNIFAIPIVIFCTGIRLGELVFKKE